MLQLPMPKELEDHLKVSGAILWEEFTKTAVNKYDVKGVISQHLGSFETGITILPPVNSLYIDVADDSGPGMFKNQLDLKPLYIAIESQIIQPGALKKTIYELGIELTNMQMMQS